ncbi:MAG: DNA-binding protein WhiA [Clostridiales bacterium]|nr:DNA-binding protein WhiA [Clostridiales bacterium]
MNSFSVKTKNDLCSSPIKKKCCQTAFLYGYLYASDACHEQKIILSFESDIIRKYVSKILTDLFFIEVAEEKTVILRNEDMAKELFAVFEFDGSAVIRDLIYTCEHCSRYFMRGLFISAGHLTDPNKSYQLDFTGLSEEKMAELHRFLAWQGLPAGRSRRNGKPILYYKSMVKIEAFLRFVFASSAVFELINAEMIGEERNELNRLGNFENANLNRTISAASEQIAAVKRLFESHQIKQLSDELQYTAELRMQHPEASLAALAALHEPPITKSGLTHRLKKIVEIAQAL